MLSLLGTWAFLEVVMLVVSLPGFGVSFCVCGVSCGFLGISSWCGVGII